MKNQTVKEQAHNLYNAATPTIKIHRVGGRLWKRNVATGSRIGPWLQGEYTILNETAWREQTPCLYMVTGSDGLIRYVGISRNGLKHRWRTSPAYDAETMTKLPKNQIFHSQCWKHIEQESSSKPNSHFEVRVITAERIKAISPSLGEQLKALIFAFDGDGESIVAGVERWLCNHRAQDLVSWNVSMTGRQA